MPTITKRVVIRSQDKQKGTPSQYLVRIPPTFKNITKIKLLYFSGFVSSELGTMTPISIQPGNITSSGSQGVLYDEGVLGDPIIVTDSPTLTDLTVSNALVVDAAGSVNINAPANLNNAAAVGEFLNVNNASAIQPEAINVTSGNIRARSGIIQSDTGISLVNDLTITQGLHPNQIRPTGLEDEFLAIRGGVPTFSPIILSIAHYIDDGTAGSQTVPNSTLYRYQFVGAYIRRNDNTLINTGSQSINIPPNQTYLAVCRTQGVNLLNDFDLNFGFYERGPPVVASHVVQGTYTATMSGPVRRIAPLVCLLEGNVGGSEYEIYYDNRAASTYVTNDYDIESQVPGADALSIHLSRVK